MYENFVEREKNTLRTIEDNNKMLEEMKTIKKLNESLCKE